MSRLSSALVIFLALMPIDKVFALWEYQTFDFTSMGNYFGGVSSSSGSDTSCGWELDRRGLSTPRRSFYYTTKHGRIRLIERWQLPDIDPDFARAGSGTSSPIKAHEVRGHCCP